MKEKIKKWWNRNPCCITNSQKTGKEFFREVEQVVYSMHPWMKNYFNDCGNKVILEVGCGLGRDLVQFARKGAIVTGLDMSSESIKLAKQNFKLNNLKANFFIGDAENLSFLDKSFDIVYSYGVLHHTVDTQKGLDEIHRVLKPGGKAIVMLYNKWSLVRLTHPDIRKYEGRKPEEKEKCPVLQIFSTTEVKKMFSEFSSIKITKRFVGNKLEKYLPDAIKRRIGWHIISEAIK